MLPSTIYTIIDISLKLKSYTNAMNSSTVVDPLNY